MGDRALAIAQALVFSFFILVGLLALLVPQDKYSRTLERLRLVGKGSEVGKGLQRRLVGLVFVLFGFFGLAGGLRSIREPEASGQPPRAPNPPPRQINPEWLPFVLGLFVVSLGFFVAFNPELLIQWSERTLFPGRRIPERVLRTWSIALRIMGVLMIYASQDLFKLWLRH